MPYTWYRRARTYQIDGSYTVESDDTLTAPFYAYDSDSELFFRTGIYNVPPGIGTTSWKFEAELLDGMGNSLGVVSTKEQEIEKTATQEIWREQKNGGGWVETQVYDLSEYETLSLGIDFYIFSNLRGTGTPPPGTYRYHVSYFINGAQQGSTEIAGTYEHRELVVVYIPGCPQDPLATDVTLKAEVYTLPIPEDSYLSGRTGWTTTSALQWQMDIDWNTGSNTLPPTSSSAAVSTPDSNGKIAEFQTTWNGKDGEGSMIATVVSILPRVVGDVPGSGNTYAENIGFATLFHRNCPCDDKDGELSFVVSIAGTSIGLLSTIWFRYLSFDFCKDPASMGYGWKSLGSATLLEQPNGALVYRDESGMVKRWTEDSGDYLPVRPDNETIAESLGNPGPPFQLTFTSQSKRVFDSSGKLVSETDRNGNTVSYNYSGTQLASISDSRGGLITYDYGLRTDGQPVGIRIGNPTTGRLIQLEYTTSGRLHKLTDPEGDANQFDYDSKDRLNKITQIRPTLGDRVVEYTYDDYNVLLEENHYNEMSVRHNRWPEKDYLFPGEVNNAYTPLVNGNPDYDNERLIYHLRDEFGRVFYYADNYTRPIFF